RRAYSQIAPPTTARIAAGASSHGRWRCAAAASVTPASEVKLSAMRCHDSAVRSRARPRSPGASPAEGIDHHDHGDEDRHGADADREEAWRPAERQRLAEAHRPLVGLPAAIAREREDGAEDDRRQRDDDPRRLALEVDQLAGRQAA